MLYICATSAAEKKGKEMSSFLESESKCSTLSLHLPLTIVVGKCSATRRTTSLI